MMTNNYAMLEIHAGKVVKILSQEVDLQKFF